MTWGSPPESAICREKALVSLGMPLPPTLSSIHHWQDAAAKATPLSPLTPAPQPGQTCDRETGTPRSAGAQGDKALHMQREPPCCPSATRLPSGRWCWWDPAWSYSPPAGERDGMSTLGCPEPGRSCPWISQLIPDTVTSTSHSRQGEP